MQRRWFLAAAAGCAFAPGFALRAAGEAVPLRLAGRPGGGLPVSVLRPAVGRASPVIIFSHGLGGRAAAYTRLARPWVDAGFLVLLPEHLDSLARGAPSRPGFAELRQYALLRIDDVKALLASLPEIAAAARRPIVPGAVGVGGHSFGAWTSVVIAGARVVLGGRRATSFGDPRPRAFLLVAGPVVPPTADAQHPFDGLTNQSFGAVTRPLMLVDGSRDYAPPGGPASYRERLAAYALSPPGNKYLGLEQNGTHMTIAGLAPARDTALAALAERTLSDLARLSVPFWQGFVGGRAAAIAWLNGAAPFAIDPGHFIFQRRLS